MIKIAKYLKRAELSDLFSPAEDIIQNQALFYQSQQDGKFYGAYFTDCNTDHCELYVKFTMGMVYVLNFETPGPHYIPIKLALSPSRIFYLKDGPNHLQTGKPYYHKKGFSVEGPFFLNNKQDPLELKKMLDEKSMYMVCRNQKIEILTNQNVLV